LQRGGNTVRPLARDHPFWTTDIFDDPGFPKLHFIEHEFSGDPTNWWLPNRAASEAMLRSAGFAIESHPEDEVYVCHRVNRSGDGYGAVYPKVHGEGA